jgi:hypothetical protein
VDIAARHFDGLKAPAFRTLEDRRALYEKVAGRLMVLRREAEEQEQRAPSTAEYLDAVRACLELGARPDDTAGEWPHIERLTLLKQPPPKAGDAETAETSNAVPETTT